MSDSFNKGFRGRRNAASPERIPPGQYETKGFPVLSAGPTPQVNLQTWRFIIEGLVASPVELTWEDFTTLPMESYTRDIHCVTKWSKLDAHWEGVSIDTLLRKVSLLPEANYVMAYCHGGYTTNIPLSDLQNGKAFIGLRFEGLPLTPEHGGPARLVVPHLYFWKSAKWIKGLRLMAEDKAGFWEQHGYSMHADPWKEQRYRSDD
jgi:DMSO/TMAO reductase YedYZ molybdopterin-dependent catalytic subunit